MKLKRDTKFREESTCRFKIAIRNLTNLTGAFESLKNFHFNGLLLGKVYIVWDKSYWGVIFHEIEEGYKIWRGMNLPFQNWLKEFGKFWPEHSKVSKTFTLIGSFWAKYIYIYIYIYFVRTKKLERSYLS